MGIKVKNLDIWMGAGDANTLGQVMLPVRTALAVAKLAIRLAELRKPIEQVRVQLVEQYSEKGADGKSVKTEAGNIKLADADGFTKAFNDLMEGQCDADVIESKIKLPEKVAGTCDKCRHNMDRAFEIEPAILVALVPFIEVA